MHRIAITPNPILIRELRTHMRGARPYVMLSIFLMILALIGAGVYQLTMQQARVGMVVLSPQVGQALFKGLAFGVLLMITIITPTLTSGAISGERERHTYDMLLATPLPPSQLLWGKLIAALSYVVLLLLAAMPLFSIVLVFGGVDLLALAKVVALFLSTTLSFGMIGLLSSTLFRRTIWATAFSYGIVVSMIGLSLTLASVWGQFSTPPGSPAPPWLLYLNPFSALFAITSITPPLDPAMSFLGYADPLSIIPFIGALGQGVIIYGPTGAEILPIYRATLIWYSVLTVGMAWLCTHLVLPTRRWRPRWSDLGFGLAVLVLGGVLLISREWWMLSVPHINPWG